ncbi:hypothetical protein AAC387_Pa02g1613 [Persea americana]
MASGKPNKALKQKPPRKGFGSKSLSRNPKTPIFKNPNHIPLGKNNRAKTNKEKVKSGAEPVPKSRPLLPSNASASQQLHFFLDRFQSANGIQLSSLELEGFNDTCMVELSEGLNQDAGNLSKHLKATFGNSWNEALCESQVLEGKISVGSPAVLIISTSALRSLELLRGVRSLTKECRPAKLFAKHIKVEDQISLLNSRVNIACGTPSRIKKLMDMDALGLSRLALVFLDMHTDVKGYSLLTLPQVSDEFWDLYRSHFHQPLFQGDLRFCLYGPSGVELKTVVPSHE